jgi:hypothetical protein
VPTWKWAGTNIRRRSEDGGGIFFQNVGKSTILHSVIFLATSYQVMCWERIRCNVYVRVSHNYESVEGLLDLSIFYTFPDKIKSKLSIRNFMTS